MSMQYDLEQLGRSLRRLREGRVGFQVDETMAGEHEFAAGWGPPGKRRLSFSVSWGPANVVRWLKPGSPEFLFQPLSGTFTVEGLCETAPCQGTLELRYFDEHKIRYSIDFDASGRHLRYLGEKTNIHLWNLPTSHTTCYGRITDARTGALVSTSITRFPLTSLPRLLLSLRLT